MDASHKFTKSKMSKSLFEDLNSFMDLPKDKKIQKRQKMEPTVDDDMSKLIVQYPMKKMKVIPDTADAEMRKKILEADDQQRQARKQYNDKIFKDLSEITSQVEADYNAMKENEQKLEQLTGAFMTCIRQSTAVFKLNLEALHEVKLFQKRIEEKESEHKEETEQIMDKLDVVINKLRDKINKESKTKSWDRMRHILNEMQQDV